MTTYSKLLLKNNKVQLRNGKALAKGRGLYTPAEITDMVNNDSYIPIASASELDALRNTVSQTMGSGTQWEGTYTTGLDKKYVQVRDMDCSSISDFDTLENGSGECHVKYDGNDLYLQNISILTGTVGIFGLITNSGFLKNINVVDFYSQSNISVSILAAGLLYQNGDEIIENCHSYNANTILSAVGASFTGMIGRNGDGITSGSTIRNCSNNDYTHTTNSTANNFGGIVGQNYGSNALVENCRTNKNKCLFVANNAGGICGRNYGGGIIRNCKDIDTHLQFGTLSNALFAGGIVGRNEATIENSLSINVIIDNPVSGNVCRCVGSIAGGSIDGNVNNCIGIAELLSADDIVGSGFGQLEQGANVLNCYSLSKEIVSAGANKGGMIGRLFSYSGTITNSYYDSDVTGFSDTGKGEPRTTKQLQNGTADSFINPDGSVDLTESSANAMFTAWDNTIWKFNPNNKYPRLR